MLNQNSLRAIEAQIVQNLRTTSLGQNLLVLTKKKSLIWRNFSLFSNQLFMVCGMSKRDFNRGGLITCMDPHFTVFYSLQLASMPWCYTCNLFITVVSRKGVALQVGF